MVDDPHPIRGSCVVGWSLRAQEILERKLAGLPAQQLSRDDREWLVASTPGWSGADLDNLCREAALYALRHDITASHVRNPRSPNQRPPPPSSLLMCSIWGRVARGLLKLTPLPRCRCWCCDRWSGAISKQLCSSSSATPPLPNRPPGPRIIIKKPK